MKPTIIGGGGDQVRVMEITPVLPALLPVATSGFSVALSGQETRAVSTKLAATSIATIPLRSIALLEEEPLQALHRTLDAFLAKVNASADPQLFTLFDKLQQGVDAEKLPELADKILNGQVGLFDRAKAFLNKRARQEAVTRMMEETNALVRGKTATLVDKVNSLERELNTKQRLLDEEVSNMEALKDAYREHFRDFVVSVAFMEAFLEQSRAFVAAKKQSSDLNDPIQKMEVDDLDDKLLALESRSLALMAKMTSLPASQLVIRQIESAAIATLQETATSASGRFASIKETLLQMHSALAVRNVQRLAQQGAALDANLQAIRGKLVGGVVMDAVNAPGANRLAQANQLKAIVDQTRELLQLVNDGREKTEKDFAQARGMIVESQHALLDLGKHIRPDKPVEY